MIFADETTALLVTAICTGAVGIISAASAIVMQVFALYRERRNRAWDLEDRRLAAVHAQVMTDELKANTETTRATQLTVQEVKVATDGMTSKLVDAEKKASFAAGRLEEIDAGVKEANGDHALKEAVDEVPEKTAKKVVEKLNPNGGD